jgi:decaprenylphospho-beta-D-erythro-pentofuranosid-2-ulose 2-reductase
VTDAASASPRTAVVFGGNSEIAVATIEALAAEGLQRVVLAVRDPAKAIAIEDLRARCLDVHAIAFDADATATHPAVVDEAFARLGGTADLALVAFGVLGDQARAKRDHETAVALAHTNFTGAVSVLTLLGERMRAQRSGTIVLLSSVAAVRARRANYPYGAAKAGVDAFAQGLADDLHDHGVRVMVVRPGFVHTKMTAGRPAPPLSSDPATIARDIVAGLHRGATTVWAPRSMRFVFGLVRLLPRPLMRRLKS